MMNTPHSETGFQYTRRQVGVQHSKPGSYSQTPVTRSLLSGAGVYEFQEGSDEQLANDLKDFEPTGFRIDSAK